MAELTLDLETTRLRRERRALTLLPIAALLWGVLRMGGPAATAAGSPARGTAKPAALPADPQPGSFLPETGAQTVKAALLSLDAATGIGMAGGEPGGKPLSFRLLPYTAFWRFGAAGATLEEFRPGERVLLKLVPYRGQGSYALEVADEITEQTRTNRCYRMVSQDRGNYRFTAEPIDAGTGAASGPHETLEYGRQTFLVLREDPVYVFRAAAGGRFWINSGYPKEGDPRMAREVLDEPSLKRFQGQQRLRLGARLDAAGAGGYVIGSNAKGGQIRTFPDTGFWASRLSPGDEIRLGKAGAPPAGTIRVRSVHADPPAPLLETDPLPAGLKARDRLLVSPVREATTYVRDIRPILEVNCLTCHRDGDARSGYSLSSAERMRAGSRRGPGVVPGKSAESMLYLTASGDRNPHMPPDRDLTPEQLALVKSWIDAGAAVE